MELDDHDGYGDRIRRDDAWYKESQPFLKWFKERPTTSNPKLRIADFAFEYAGHGISMSLVLFTHPCIVGSLS